MTYEILDNFLSEEDHKNIYDTMLSAEFPWFYNDYIVGPNEEDTVYNYQFTHNFYMDYGWQSNFAYLVNPLIYKLEPKSLVRIKANLSPATPSNISGRWHTDYQFACKTAVYYVNDNDGYTQFRSNHKVESKANRLVVFDSHDIHTGATATNSKARCVINFNYF